MNRLDKFISFFSPELGAKRAELRLKESRLRSYEAATQGRRGDGWNSTNSNNANTEIQRAAPILRKRSIDAYKNNPSAFSAHRKIQNNVIGTGIMPTPVSIAGEKKLTKNEIEIIKAEWKAFAESKACDFNNMMPMGALQSLGMRTLSVQGEVFVMRQRDASSRIPFKLQILSPAMVDHQKSSLLVAERSGNFIVQGIEFDSRGRKVGFWVYDRDSKNDFSLNLAPKFVPVSDMFQVYYMDFPEQVRGLPNGVPSMLGMKDLDEYEDAQLLLQKVSACHVGVTTRPEPLDDTVADTRAYEDYDHIEPGMMQHLRPGEEITFNNPPTPGGYGEYVSKNQQKNAAGFGITYEQMTGDMSNVNFSSGRMGWIEAQRQVEDWQYNMFIPQFCDSVWDWFIEGLIIRGIISKKAGADWTPQGREMIDPVKEMNGLILELKSGLVSWTEACKRRGYNPETLMAQIKADKDKFKELGINVEWIIENETEISDELTPNQVQNKK